MPQEVMQFIQGPGLLIIMMVAMFAIMIIPQRKREKKVKEMLSSLKVGSYIRTIGGFYGRIVQLKEDAIVFECGPEKVKLSIARSAVATVQDSDVENDKVGEK